MVSSKGILSPFHISYEKIRHHIIERKVGVGRRIERVEGTVHFGKVCGFGIPGQNRVAR